MLSSEVDFSEEMEFLDGKAGLHRAFFPREGAVDSPAIDFDTVVEHLQRNGYNMVVSPNGATKDVHGEKNGKNLHISSHRDGRAEVTFLIDVEGINAPEPYVKKVYEQAVGELMERENRLQNAAENYIENFLSEADDPIQKLQYEFDASGETTQEIVSNYFESMRPTDLIMNYAAQFELMPHESAEDERRELRGKIPLADSLEDEGLRQRNAYYIRRFLKTVLEQADQSYGLNDELKEYWMELTD